MNLFGISPLTPAYGRDYTNKKTLLEDFNANKDFLTALGKPINKEQIKNEVKTNYINIRYDQLTKIVVADVK